MVEAIHQHEVSKRNLRKTPAVKQKLVISDRKILDLELNLGTCLH